MKRRVKLLSMLIVLALLTATLGLAVPSITVEVQGIGEGSSPVYSPTGSGGYYYWVYTSSDVIANVTLSFANNLSAGTDIIVTLYNSSGEIIAIWNKTLTQPLPALEETNVTPTSQVNINNVSNITVTLLSPDLISSPGIINLQVHKIGVGLRTGDLCNPIVVSNQKTVGLVNYTVKIILNSSTQVLWNYVNSTNLYFTTDSGYPLYYWIQELDTSNENGVIWVKINSIPAEANVTICMHYGGTNPYRSYNNPEKTFLFFDDFNGSSINQSKWNVHGNPVVSNGILQLSGYYQVGNNIYGNATWIWTKQNFPTSYEVILNASLSYPDQTISVNNPDTFVPGPFYLIYINSSGVGYGETVEYYTQYNWILPTTSTYDALTNRSISTGRGTVLGYINNPYDIGSWHIFEVYVNSNGTIYTYQDDSLLVEYNLSQSTVVSGPFALGQITGRSPSEYDWVAIRNHVYPEPSITIKHWYAALKFYPQPPNTLNEKSGSATLLGISFIPLSDEMTTPELSGTVRNSLEAPRMNLKTKKAREGAEEIVPLPIPIPEGTWYTTPPFS